jgi:hydroxymethylglutaryl-CoA synthase
LKKVMKPNRSVGIVGYGAYIPRYRLDTREIAKLWRGNQDTEVMPVDRISVPGLDEDTATMAIEAAKNALMRARIEAEEIRGVWVGSESHPYAVKTTSSIVAEALGIAPHTTGADIEFACKAGTEAMQAAIGLVGSHMADYSLAIGVDTAQGRPGDALEYTASAGGAAYIVGPAEKAVAVLEGSCSYVTDTPDFFRRENRKYPEHANRFTGEPAYFHHILSAVRTLFSELELDAKDFTAAIFHQPNVKYPKKVAKMLGFKSEQIETGLLSRFIGNTYAGASPLGLTAVLDEAEAGQRVLMASFGSGAGSDAFSFIVTDKIKDVVTLANTTKIYLNREEEVNYALYARMRDKID